MKTMSATLASKEFGRFIDAAQREPVLLTKKDRPVAVTVSVADWEELVALRIERGIAADVAALEADRAGHTPDHVVDFGGIQVVAIAQRRHHRRRKVFGVHRRKGALAHLADTAGGPYRVDDIGVCHVQVS